MNLGDTWRAAPTLPAPAASVGWVIAASMPSIERPLVLIRIGERMPPALPRGARNNMTSIMVSTLTLGLMKIDAPTISARQTATAVTRKPMSPTYCHWRWQCGPTCPLCG